MSFDNDLERMAREDELAREQFQRNMAHYDRQIHFSNQMMYAGFGIIAAIVLGPLVFFLGMWILH